MRFPTSSPARTIALAATMLVAACGDGDPGGPDPIGEGEWGTKAPLLDANSELALAEANGRLYLLGGYPASRQTQRTVQVYDIANNKWELGPQLPQPNNHGMAASVSGKIYLIGGQTSDVSDQGYQNTVYELDPSVGTWVEKTAMPTARPMFSISSVAMALPRSPAFSVTSRRARSSASWSMSRSDRSSLVPARWAWSSPLSGTRTAPSRSSPRRRGCR